jgi:predicted HicB family RNase H-like nuclease
MVFACKSPFVGGQIHSLAKRETMSAMSGEQRKPGRPRKFGQGRINATVRFTPENHAAVRIAAETQGRSVSEEVEVRVQQSFQNEALIPVLEALLARQARAGTVLAGWLATELRAIGVDETIATRLSEMIKAYFGRERGKP